MISFKEFIKEDAPVNSGFGGPGIAKYDPLLGQPRKKLFRRKHPAPLTKIPRVRGMEI
jgi:hypothetical protein